MAVWGLHFILLMRKCLETLNMIVVRRYGCRTVRRLFPLICVFRKRKKPPTSTESERSSGHAYGTGNVNSLEETPDYLVPVARPNYPADGLNPSPSREYENVSNVDDYDVVEQQQIPSTGERRQNMSGNYESLNTKPQGKETYEKLDVNRSINGNN